MKKLVFRAVDVLTDNPKTKEGEAKLYCPNCGEGTVIDLREHLPLALQLNDTLNIMCENCKWQIQIGIVNE